MGAICTEEEASRSFLLRVLTHRNSVIFYICNCTSVLLYVKLPRPKLSGNTLFVLRYVPIVIIPHKVNLHS
jgi:hypothetical protein